MLLTNRVADVGASIMLVGPGDFEALRRAVGDIANLPDSFVAYADALAAVKRLKPNIVLVWLDDDLDSALQIAEDLHDSARRLRLVAWSDTQDSEQVRRALRAGFQEYFLLPDDRNCLREAILVGEGALGRFIAVFGAKGGAGASLLALNLAAELAATRKTLLVDMDLSMGDIGIMADLKCNSSVGDLLRSSARLDFTMLESATMTHGSGLRILGQPSDTAFQELPEGAAVVDFLRMAGVGYDVMVLDCGSRLDVPGLVALSEADDIILVTHPEVPAVRDAWRCLSFLDQVGVSRDHVKVVVNRWSKGVSLELREIETNLGHAIYTTLAEDGRTASTAVNEGRLLSEVNPRSILVKEIKGLAERLVPLPERPVQSVPRRFWPFTRVLAGML